MGEFKIVSNSVKAYQKLTRGLPEAYQKPTRGLPEGFQKATRRLPEGFIHLGTHHDIKRRLLLWTEYKLDLEIILKYLSVIMSTSSELFVTR